MVKYAWGMKEYAVWGKCPQSPDEETLLLTRLTSLKAAKRGEKTLIEKHGCFETRIQTIDFTKDLAESFRKL